MNLAEHEGLSAIVLGIIQGLTEFLPVSSSGHLVLTQTWLPTVGDPVAFDLALHLGTLVPVLIVYRNDLLGIARDAARGTSPLTERRGLRLLAWMVLGSIPTAIIGIGFEEQFSLLFHNYITAGIAFAITGGILFATRYAPRGSDDELSMTWWQAMLIGLVQGIAITPGISRSGSTIAAALFLGMDRSYAARFSFLLSIPAIGGAFLLKLPDLELGDAGWQPIAMGTLAASVSGYLALIYLIRLVRSGDFSRFCWYLWPLAAVTLGIAFLG